MSAKTPPRNEGGRNEITILLVDDIPETRENIKKLLAFELDFKVVGAAGTGREGVELAKTYEPDIIIMDINMPDMDGLQATSLITKHVPTCAVIIMSVQNEADYMRRAMLAGARDFLTKPINMDELYNTIRTVYKNHEATRRQYESRGYVLPETHDLVEGERAGHIVAVYSPQGGVGVTTVATSLASGLMKEGVKVLLVDADLQFGDIPTFLNLQAQSTLIELIDDVDDMDVDLFENIVMTHESGLKVLPGPKRPELADEIKTRPDVVATILKKVAPGYDFIVVDTSTALDEVALSIFDIAHKIVLVGQPTLISVKNLRFVLDLFDQLEYSPDKTFFILNRVLDDRKKNATISSERIENFLKRPIAGRIPAVDERLILNAINRGVPIIASDRDQSKAPIKQLLEISELLYNQLMGETEEEDSAEKEKKASGISGWLGR
jgi:pilus assembly protein CpaE